MAALCQHALTGSFVAAASSVATVKDLVNSLPVRQFTVRLSNQVYLLWFFAPIIPKRELLPKAGACPTRFSHEYLRDSFCSWSNRFVDFLDAKCDPQSALSLMHSLTILIEGNMKRFYEPALISICVEQALKFCVQDLVTFGAHGRTGWFARLLI